MIFGETEEILKKQTDSHIEMTSNFLNTSLGALNAANPFFFNAELIDTWKNTFSRSTSFNQSNIKLFNDMTNLGYVYVIENMDAEEIKLLEKGIENEE